MRQDRQAAGRGQSARFAEVFAPATGPLADRIDMHVTLGAVASESLHILRGTSRQMADELQRRREVTGISYVSVNGAFAEQFAPVVGLLAGH
jgi:hypothetical protein